VRPQASGGDFLSRAVREASPHVGPPPVGEEDAELLAALDQPAMVVLLPFAAADLAVGLLYGEFAADGAPPEVEGLMAFLARAAGPLHAGLEEAARRRRARQVRERA